MGKHEEEFITIARKNMFNFDHLVKIFTLIHRLVGENAVIYSDTCPYDVRIIIDHKIDEDELLRVLYEYTVKVEEFSVEDKLSTEITIGLSEEKKPRVPKR